MVETFNESQMNVIDSVEAAPKSICTSMSWSRTGMLSVLLRTPSMPLYLRYKRMALPSGTVRGPGLGSKWT